MIEELQRLCEAAKSEHAAGALVEIVGNAKRVAADYQDDEEVQAIVETAHAGGKPVVAHAHREDEIRMGLKHGVDCFEHTGLATEPAYHEVLSARSEITLQFQGGVMTSEEAAAFARRPDRDDLVTLRRADDAAKVRGKVVADVEHWRRVLDEVAAKNA